MSRHPIVMSMEIAGHLSDAQRSLDEADLLATSLMNVLKGTGEVIEARKLDNLVAKIRTDRNEVMRTFLLLATRIEALRLDVQMEV